MNNISFSDIDFQYASDNLVHLQDTDGITFDKCGFSFSGDNMLLANSNFNKHCTVTNSTINYINSDGFKVYGGGNDGLKIQYNTFTNMGIFPGEGGVNEYRAITLENANTANADISFNKIDNVGFCGISAAGGSNLLIKNNYITNFCFLMDDGAAIYIQDLSATPNKRITGNILINGGAGVGDGTAEPTSNQAYGIYSDGGNSNTQIDNNSIANCGNGGIYMDDSHDINIHHNTVYNCLTGISIDYLGTSAIYNLTMKNNTLVNTDNSSHVFAPQKQTSSGIGIGAWGTIDSNYYARPLNDTKTIYSWAGTGNGIWSAIAEWPVVYGHDAHSKKSPTSVSNASMIRFEYNETSSSKTVGLNSNYMAINGTVYSGSLTLAPYSSIVLLQTSALPSNQSPTANAGADKTITLPLNTQTQTGSGTDPDGTIASYQWTKISGPCCF